MPENIISEQEVETLLSDTDKNKINPELFDMLMSDADVDVHSLTASVYTGAVCSSAMSADVACPELSAGRLGPGSLDSLYTGMSVPTAATSSQLGDDNPHGHSLPLMTIGTQPPLPADAFSQGAPALVDVHSTMTAGVQQQLTTTVYTQPFATQSVCTQPPHPQPSSTWTADTATRHSASSTTGAYVYC